MLLPLRTVLAKTSAARINKYWERGQPCLTPLWGWKKLLDQPLLSTQLSPVLQLKVLTQLISDGPKPKNSVSKIKGHSRESKAFSKSIKSNGIDSRLFLYYHWLKASYHIGNVAQDMRRIVPLSSDWFVLVVAVSYTADSKKADGLWLEETKRVRAIMKGILSCGPSTIDWALQRRKS